MNLFEQENNSVCGLTNVFAIAIVVDPSGDTLKYQYNNETELEPKEAEIQYTVPENEEEESEPYFETKEGMQYFLREFTRRI